MRELIIQSLHEAYAKLLSQIPETKKVPKYLEITDVEPKDLLEFMKLNNVPDDAVFGGKPNGYDAYESVCLVYDVEFPTSNKEKSDFKISRFPSLTYSILYRKATELGYVRVPIDSRILNSFKGTSIYEAYLDKDFDKLVEYYSSYYIH